MSRRRRVVEDDEERDWHPPSATQNLAARRLVGVHLLHVVAATLWSLAGAALALQVWLRLTVWPSLSFGAVHTRPREADAPPAWHGDAGADGDGADGHDDGAAPTGSLFGWLAVATPSRWTLVFLLAALASGLAKYGMVTTRPAVYSRLVRVLRVLLRPSFGFILLLEAVFGVVGGVALVEIASGPDEGASGRENAFFGACVDIYGELQFCIKPEAGIVLVGCAATTVGTAVWHLFRGHHVIQFQPLQPTRMAQLWSRAPLAVAAAVQASALAAACFAFAVRLWGDSLFDAVSRVGFYLQGSYAFSAGEPVSPGGAELLSLCLPLFARCVLLLSIVSVVTGEVTRIILTEPINFVAVAHGVPFTFDSGRHHPHPFEHRLSAMLLAAPKSLRGSLAHYMFPSCDTAAVSARGELLGFTGPHGGSVAGVSALWSVVGLHQGASEGRGGRDSANDVDVGSNGFHRDSGAGSAEWEMRVRNGKFASVPSDGRRAAYVGPYDAGRKRGTPAALLDALRNVTWSAGVMGGAMGGSLELRDKRGTRAADLAMELVAQRTSAGLDSRAAAGDPGSQRRGRSASGGMTAARRRAARATSGAWRDDDGFLVLDDDEFVVSPAEAFIAQWRGRFSAAEAALYAGIVHSRGRLPIWAELARMAAFADLATSAHHSEAARREIFADITGNRWKSVLWTTTAVVDALTLELQVVSVEGVAPLVAQLRQPRRTRGCCALSGSFLARLAAEFSEMDPLVEQEKWLDGSPTSSVMGPEWRARDAPGGSSQRTQVHLFAGALAGGRDVSASQRRGRPRYGRLTWLTLLLQRSPAQVAEILFEDLFAVIKSIEAISGLMAASAEEDRHGVTEHSLAVVLSSLLACLFAVERYCSAPVFLGGVTPPLYLEGHAVARPAPSALKEALKRALYTVVGALPTQLTSVDLAEPYMTRIQSFLDYNE